MAEVSRDFQLDILHVHYAVPHATAAILARDMLPPGTTAARGHHLAWHGHHLAGLRPGLRPRHPPRPHPLGCRHHRLRTSCKRKPERVLGFTGPMEVIHNFFTPRPPRRSREEVRRELGLRDEVVIFHASNLRPLKRIDVLLETLARLQPRAIVQAAAAGRRRFRPYAADVLRLGLEDPPPARKRERRLRITCKWPTWACSPPTRRVSV